MTDLAQFTSTLVWIDDRLSYFEPMPKGVVDYARLKAFGELSIVWRYATDFLPRLPPDIASPVEKFVRNCSQFLQAQCNNPGYVEAARKNPVHAYAYILPYLTLRGQGYRTSSHEDLIKWLQSLGLPRSVESVPYRRWELELAFWKGDLRRKSPSYRSHYPSTSLAMRKGTLYFDVEGAYAVTHTLFYLTDFGLQDIDMPAHEIARVAILLRSLLIDHLRRTNWDLSCELLMNMYQLGLPEDQLMVEAGFLFDRIKRDDGSMPAHGKNFPKKVQRRVQQRRPADEKYMLGCYHPTLVWLLYALSKTSSKHARS